MKVYIAWRSQAFPDPYGVMQYYADVIGIYSDPDRARKAQESLPVKERGSVQEYDLQ